MIRVRLIAMLMILGALVLVSCGEGEKETTADSVQIAEKQDSLTIELFGLEGKTVLDLLSERHFVKYTWTASGVFIKEIDSVANGDGWFWTYTVNDSMIDLPADKCNSSNGERIVWHFRKQ